MTTDRYTGQSIPRAARTARMTPAWALGLLEGIGETKRTPPTIGRRPFGVFGRAGDDTPPPPLRLDDEQRMRDGNDAVGLRRDAQPQRSHPCATRPRQDHLVDTTASDTKKGGEPKSPAVDRRNCAGPAQPSTTEASNI